MAVHTGLRVWDIRVRRDFDETVTITAIHPELSNVNVMRKGHRLDRLISDARVFGRDVIPGRRGQSTNREDAADRELERQPIRPARKEIRHNESADRCCGPVSKNLSGTIREFQKSAG